jgi:DNA-binding transcriptional MerR regulator
MSSAPSMSAYSQDLCLVGISGGVSTIGLSLSGGSYMIDENCERIKLSKTLSDLGMKVAAVSILCQDERVFFAMEQSGTPCPFEGKIGKAAADQWKKYDKLRPDYDMYTSRLWTIEQQKKEAKKKQELKEWKDKLEVKKEVEGDSTETDELAKEIKKLQETIKEDKKKVKNQ